MEIPPLNVSIKKAAIDGKVVDVIDYDEYFKNINSYKDRNDVVIETKYNDKDILLPVKGKRAVNQSIPGVYNAGCVDFLVYPNEGFVDKYVAKDIISMSNTDSIKDLIKAGDEAKKLDEPFITSPDNITNIPIKADDQPEMVALKTALNAKNIDIDKYAGRFSDNFPNDKRQLKNKSCTLNIIKRFCKNCDMEAVLILRDKNADVPNPMNREVMVVLTDREDDDEEYED
jgi:hypothetical protein